MLRLQPFEIFFPRDLVEATSLLLKHAPSAILCAGGTDLLPNMKHELHEPRAVIHLSQVSDLKQAHESHDRIVIGAMTTLSELSSNPLIIRYAPSLAKAALQVASPQIRNMGTLGGNICLDTRCLYYNQSHFWREAIGYCLKKCGDTCHVTKTGKRCVAASSNDTATVLMCLDASVEIISEKGMRTVPISEFYVANGEKNTVLADGEILTRVIIPKPNSGVRRREGFSKLRNREAIDFSMLSIAVRLDVDENEQIVAGKMTVNALAAKPKSINLDWMLGRKMSRQLADEAGEFAKAKCIPLTNICDDPLWRKEMVSVYVKRAIASAFSEGEVTLSHSQSDASDEQL